MMFVHDISTHERHGPCSTAKLSWQRVKAGAVFQIRYMHHCTVQYEGTLRSTAPQRRNTAVLRCRQLFPVRIARATTSHELAYLNRFPNIATLGPYCKPPIHVFETGPKWPKFAASRRTMPQIGKQQRHDQSPANLQCPSPRPQSPSIPFSKH